MSYRFGWYNFPSSSRMPSNFCEALKHLMIQNKIESHDFEVKVCYRSNILYAVGIAIIWFMELKAPIWNGFQSTGPFTLSLSFCSSVAFQVETTLWYEYTLLLFFVGFLFIEYSLKKKKNCNSIASQRNLSSYCCDLGWMTLCDENTV